ncbi:MAG: GTPase/DUF3482 domain-containing protein [Desulfobacterales bacterium]|nr:GTPase/DUF3482 domain-containing protein [Desulfobacterales bacterium]
MNNSILSFAIVGHPNEGKSAVVSTLAENDSVRVSPTPGETKECQPFSVKIDGKERIRFIDTPGFQNPQKILQWIKQYQGLPADLISHFRKEHIGNPNFKDDCELFKPIAEGSGIIFIADGSRPIRRSDLAEMEILRLTGLPRMAILNCKQDETFYLDQWKSEFRKHFNMTRLFNANRATYAERIELLEALKSIDQDWTIALEDVISAFKKDWENRNYLTTEIICALLYDALSYRIQKRMTHPYTTDNTEEKLLYEQFNHDIASMEKKSREMIRALFKHNIFNVDLPAHSILHDDLMSKKTWKYLGLTSGELVAAAGLAGGIIGAVFDLATAGLTFGLFSAIGSLTSASLMKFKGKQRLAKTKLLGIHLGKQTICLGPIENIQFMYVLLDRMLIFYSYIINWSHGRRDYPASSTAKIHPNYFQTGLIYSWNEQSKNICNEFFHAVRSKDTTREAIAGSALKKVLINQLMQLSQSEKRYGIIMQ